MSVPVTATSASRVHSFMSSDEKNSNSKYVGKKDAAYVCRYMHRRRARSLILSFAQQEKGRMHRRGGKRNLTKKPLPQGVCSTCLNVNVCIGVIVDTPFVVCTCKCSVLGS